MSPSEDLSPPACPETPSVHGRALLEGCQSAASDLPPRNPLRLSKMESELADEDYASARTSQSPVSRTPDASPAKHTPSEGYDTDLEHSDNDNDSVGDLDLDSEAETAAVVHFCRPPLPTLIDIFRREKPVSKRPNPVILRKPVARPSISSLQVLTRPRRSSSASGTGMSMSTYDGASLSSTPTTPSLDDDEGSTSMTSDAFSSSPTTPKSSFEQERQCFVPYKQDAPTTPLVTVLPDPSQKGKAQKPSRLRLFPRRSFILNTGPGSKTDLLDSNSVPPTIIESNSSPASEYFTPRPDSARSPASPSLSMMEPQTAKFLPARNLWRDVGKPRFLKRMESRVGLSASAVRMVLD